MDGVDLGDSSWWSHWTRCHVNILLCMNSIRRMSLEGIDMIVLAMLNGRMKSLRSSRTEQGPFGNHIMIRRIPAHILSITAAFSSMSKSMERKTVHSLHFRIL